MERTLFIRQAAAAMKWRPLSLFLGAGIGSDAGLPAWAKLFDAFKDELGIERDANISLPMIAQYYENEKGGSVASVISRYVGGNVRESGLLETALLLDPTNIWTLDYDHVIEKTLQKLGKSCNCVFSERDLPTVFAQDRINVYKLGGEVDHLSEALITKESFERFEDDHELFETFLRKELVTNTFLFLGYSFDDGIAQRSLRRIAHTLGASANTHFNIMKKNADSPQAQKLLIKDLEKRYRVKTLIVDSYDDIPVVLADIRKEMLGDRVLISGSLWMPRYGSKPDPYITCKSVALALIKSDKTVITGLGYNVGYYVSGAISEYCAKKGLRPDNHMVVSPYSHDCSKSEERAWRERMIDGVDTVVFVFGQTFDKEGNSVISKGVMEEFAIAKDKQKYIVPIGSTGYAAEKILDYVEQNAAEYAYLDPDRLLDSLRNSNQPDEIGELVSMIMDNIHQYKLARQTVSLKK